MLHHVRDIEERSVAACKMMRCTDGKRCVLDWHVETTKTHHFAAMDEMKVVKGCLAEFGGC